MSEKIPGLRIVGGATEEHKEEARARTEALLHEDHLDSLPKNERDELKKFEIQRSPAVLEAIDFANSYTNRLREEAGVDGYDIPAANYHILPAAFYEKHFGIDSSGKAIYGHQGSVYNIKHLNKSSIDTALTILHETLHLKGHLAFEVEEGRNGKPNKSLYRAGLSAYASQKTIDKGRDHVHFKGLHEAVVSILEKRAVEEILELESLEKEVARMKQKPAQDLIEKISREKGIPIDDIIWVGKNENEFQTIPYPIHRKVLKFVCEKIYNTYRMLYNSPDEVFEVFAKAQFNGKLLSLGHLVDGTFGEGSFRTLSNMLSDDESAQLCLDALEKMS
jgi:hypothetical protein